MTVPGRAGQGVRRHGHRDPGPGAALTVRGELDGEPGHRDHRHAVTQRGHGEPGQVRVGAAVGRARPASRARSVGIERLPLACCQLTRRGPDESRKAAASRISRARKVRTHRSGRSSSARGRSGRTSAPVGSRRRAAPPAAGRSRAWGDGPGRCRRRGTRRASRGAPAPGRPYGPCRARVLPQAPRRSAGRRQRQDDQVGSFGSWAVASAGGDRLRPLGGQGVVPTVTHRAHRPPGARSRSTAATPPGRRRCGPCCRPRTVAGASRRTARRAEARPRAPSRRSGAARVPHGERLQVHAVAVEGDGLPDEPSAPAGRTCAAGSSRSPRSRPAPGPARPGRSRPGRARTSR